MQPVVVRIEDLIGDIALMEHDDDGGLLVTFCDDSKELPFAARKLWGLILLMSVRDRATSIHYHPWRSEGTLTYIVDGTRYELVPPLTEYADTIVDTARSMFIAPGFLSWLPGRALKRTACRTLSLDVGGCAIVWDVVCWSSGERRGIEFFRVTPLEPRASVE